MKEVKYAEVEGWVNESCPNGAVRINWGINSTGFGVLDIVFDEKGIAHFYTEHMADNKNKKFLTDIFNKIIEDGVVED